MLRRLPRVLLFAALAASTIYGALGVGRLTALVVALGWLITLGGVLVWLPRWAHSMFVRGEFARSQRRYRVLRVLLLDRHARDSVDVSRAACWLALEDYDAALRLLARLDPDSLPEATRAAWLNNRAYALARSERDFEAALEQCNSAITLRPDVVGFRHTRGVALLGLGRTDEAIRELDDLWRELAADAPPLLEAERCFDLARAWQSKGEPDYATDYLERARRAAPTSTWARRASEQLAAVGRPISSPVVFADLL